ncbi:MAG: YfhO family protein [Armatimonadetes bacterium]|nr:YfhO family protein [Armatimonadota bacterium]
MPRRDLLAGLLIGILFVLWFAPAAFGGRILAGEDTFAYFFAERSQMYRAAHGEGLSWWDSLPGLGVPRFANSQHGYFSPFSTLFYLVDTAAAFRWYPILMLTCITLACYGLLRVMDLAPLAAAFGALSWSTLGTILGHVQHPPVLETLVWLPVALLCWEKYLATRRVAWLPAAALAVALQVYGGSPQYVVYNALVMAAWVTISLTRAESRSKAVAAAFLVAVAGLLLAAWQLLPALELSRISARNLVDKAAFTDNFRASLREIPLAFAAEVFIRVRPPMDYGHPYENSPNLSLIVLPFFILGLRRYPLLGIAVAFFLLGMLGSAGGVTPLLAKVFPFTQQLRAPVRMLVPAAFLVSFLAAAGMDFWLRPAARRQWLCVAALVWLVGVGWLVKRSTDRYVEPSDFQVPPAVAAATPRLTVGLIGDANPLAPSMGIIAGLPTLFTREAVWPQNFFEAIFASQFGDLGENRRKVDICISNNVLPLVEPHRPLLRAFGLRTVLTPAAGPSARSAENWKSLPLQPATPDCAVFAATIPVTDAREGWRLARATDWDPLRQALAPAGLAVKSEGPATATFVRRAADEEEIAVRGGGGLLVVSGLSYPGWRVEIDGVPASPVDANLALRGVVVPPGTHRVVWRHVPTWLGQAWIATVAGVLLLAGGCFWLRPSKRSGPRRLDAGDSVTPTE